MRTRMTRNQHSDFRAKATTKISAAGVESAALFI